MALRPEDRAFQLVNGFRATQVVAAAVRLRIPDLLAAGPKSAEKLSDETRIDADRLRRLLRGLVTLGVVAEQDDGRFVNTEVGELFPEGVPGSRRAMAMMLVPESYRAWDHFMETLRTGVTGHSLAHGGSLWETLQRDPDGALLVDVGGGKGALVGGILRSNPRLRGMVCDIPAGLAETHQYLAELGVADRCSVVEADFFKSLPSGGDVYLLKDIIHDWDDEHAAVILSVCRRATGPRGRILMVERGLPSKVTDAPAHLNSVMTDLQMMVQLGGRERTLDEFRRLLDGASFKLTRSVPGTPWQLVEAEAV